jgi:membrane protein
MTRRDIVDLLKLTYDEWNNDNVPRLGAALAYYTVLSMAPLLIVVVAVAGMVYGQKAAQGQIVWQIQGLVGYQVAQAIQGILEAAQGPGKGIFATVVGIVTLVLGASLVVSELRSTLNLIWKVPIRSDEFGIFKGLLKMVQYRFGSFLMVLGAGLLLLASLVISTIFAAVGKNLQSLIAPTPAVMQIVYLFFWFAVTTLMFALIYKILPEVHMHWSDVIVGAVVTSVLFTIGRLLIGLYLGKSTVASAYGAAGSVVLILVWVYYSAQVFFFGAEFTYIYTNKYGSRFRARLTPGPKPSEEPVRLTAAGPSTVPHNEPLVAKP